MAKVDFERMMRILLPYLMQRKIQREYLERSYGQAGQLAREKDRLARGYQKEVQDRASENAIKLELVKTGRVGVEDLDRPLDELLLRLGQAGVTHPALPTISPEIIEERRRPYGDIMARMSSALEKARYLPAEQVAPATKLLGSERVMDFLKEAGKERAGKKERELREGELRVREREVGIKKGGETDKELKEQVTNLTKKVSILSDQMESIEIEEGLGEGDPKYEELKARRDSARNKALNILNQLLGELNKKKADKIVAKLKAGGAKVKALEKHKERLMKEENLTEEEYQYIKLNLR